MEVDKCLTCERNFKNEYYAGKQNEEEVSVHVCRGFISCGLWVKGHDFDRGNKDVCRSKH